MATASTPRALIGVAVTVVTKRISRAQNVSVRKYYIFDFKLSLSKMLITMLECPQHICIMLHYLYCIIFSLFTVFTVFH